MVFIGKKVLVVSPEFPYPPSHGGIVDIWRRIEILREMKVGVHLVCTVKRQPDAKYLDVVRDYVEKLTLVPRKNSVIDLWSMEPLQVRSRKRLASVPLDIAYDVALLDGEYVAAVLGNPTLRTRYILLRVNNVEDEYFRSLAGSTSNPLKKAYYMADALRFKRTTEKVLRSADKVMFASYDDYRRFSSWADLDVAARYIFLPPPVNICITKERQVASRQVLFVGSLFVPNNVQAVLWYLRNVHPALLDVPGYKFVIVGSTKGKKTDWLGKILARIRSVEKHLDVDDLEPIYEKTAVIVNPMLAGAGIKLKTINALAAGIPVVSTKVGNEGTGFKDGEDLLVTDDPSMFAQNVRLLLFDRDKALRLVRNAQQKLSSNYNHACKLGNIFDELFRGDVLLGAQR